MWNLFKLQIEEEESNEPKLLSKSLEANLHTKIEYGPKKESGAISKRDRKTSLPSNVLLSIHKPKDWIKDKSWLKVPDEGIVEESKLNRLKDWFKTIEENQSIEDLEAYLDWENNKPQSRTTCGQQIDPYKVLWAEKYLVEEPEIETIRQFSGDAKLTLTNGDKFEGSFKCGEREGSGILTFGLIHRRKFEIQKIEGSYENDQLQGNGNISYVNGDKLICNFVNGVPNGPAKLFDSQNHIKQVRPK